MGPKVSDTQIRPVGVNERGTHYDFSNYFLIIFIQGVETLVISLLEASPRLMMSRW